MVPYYGDFPEDATVYIPINTFDSNDPAASVTVTNLLNTDVHIHKNGGTTQRNNAAGITMTIDYDSITGNHLLIIDTSDDTVAGFWVTGAEYQVRVEGITVDAGTLNSWVGAFSIERTGGALALLKSATYGLSAIKTETAAILVDTGTTLQGELDAIEAAVITNAAGADIAADIIALKAETVEILTDTAVIGASGAGLTALATQASVNTIDGIVDDILVDTAVIGALGAGLTALSTQASVDAIKAETALIVADTNELQTDDYPTSIAAVKADTAAILLDTGTDGVVIPQAQADKVWGTAARALTDKADFALSAASRAAVWDEAGSITSLSFELLLERLYEMVNNKMIVTEATGAVALRNLADGADVATGNVQDLGATTQRNAFTWV